LAQGTGKGREKRKRGEGKATKQVQPTMMVAVRSSQRPRRRRRRRTDELSVGTGLKLPQAIPRRRRKEEGTEEGRTREGMVTMMRMKEEEPLPQRRGQC